MQRLSILVPLMGDLKRFEDTLVSVLENRPDRSEVVVVTNRPYDDPYDLRGEVTFVDAPLGAGLVECFACGLAASRAAVVHLLGAGVEVTPGWADAALARFNEPDVAAVAPLVIDRERPERILSAGLRYTRAGSIARIAAGSGTDRFQPDERLLCGPELVAAFYRRDALAAVESLPNDGSELAPAIELAFALRVAGYHCVQESRCLTNGCGELFTARGGWREGVAGERLFRRWSAAGGWKRSWLGHAALLASESLQVPLRPWLIGRLGGRLWATLGLGGGGEVAFDAGVAPQQHGSMICPAQFAAAESRAA